MKKIASIITIMMTIAMANATNPYIKVVINGEEISANSIPEITYYDNCVFSLVGEAAGEATQWETRVGLDCQSATTAYQVYNPQEGVAYTFSLATLDETIQLPQTESNLSWSASENYVSASISVNTSKGWIYSIPVKLKLIPEPPVVEAFEVYDVVYANADENDNIEDEELFGCCVRLTWDTPEFPVQPIKVITKTTNNYYVGQNSFSAPGYGEYINTAAFDHDVIEIYAENRYGKSAVQRFSVSDYAGVENVSADENSVPKAIFRDGNIEVSGIETDQQCDLSLYTVSGIKVGDMSAICEANGFIKWQLGEADSGMYILKLIAGNKLYSYKIIKTN